MPIALFVLLCSTRTTSFVFGTPEYASIKAADDYLITQIIAADKNGLDSVEVEYPDWYPADARAMTNGYIPVIASALYKHGMISKEMTVTLR